MFNASGAKPLRNFNRPFDFFPSRLFELFEIDELEKLSDEFMVKLQVEFGEKKSNKKMTQKKFTFFSVSA